MLAVVEVLREELLPIGRGNRFLVCRTLRRNHCCVDVDVEGVFTGTGEAANGERANSCSSFWLDPICDAIDWSGHLSRGRALYSSEEDESAKLISGGLGGLRRDAFHGFFVILVSFIMLKSRLLE